MYQAHFGFSGMPFQLHPDTSFVFESRAVREVLARLAENLASRTGILVLTGEIGAGKTTVARMLVERSDRGSVCAAHVVSSRLEAGELIRTALHAFGAPLPDAEGEPIAPAAAFRRFVRQLDAGGRRPLLVVDEAQNLDLRTLMELHALAQPPAGEPGLPQVVLVGQSELRARLHEPELAPLRERVLVSCHLGALEIHETAAYVDHRLRRVGWRGFPALLPVAVAAIHESTGGIPRRINRLCHRLLVSAYLLDRHEIGETLVRDTARLVDAEVGDAAGRTGSGIVAFLAGRADPPVRPSPPRAPAAPRPMAAPLGAAAAAVAPPAADSPLALSNSLIAAVARAAASSTAAPARAPAAVPAPEAAPAAAPVAAPAAAAGPAADRVEPSASPRTGRSRRRVALAALTATTASLWLAWTVHTNWQDAVSSPQALELAQLAPTAAGPTAMPAGADDAGIAAASLLAGDPPPPLRLRLDPSPGFDPPSAPHPPGGTRTHAWRPPAAAPE